MGRSLIHFLLIGACLFLASRWIAPRDRGPDPDGTIAITSDTIARIRREVLARTGRLPNAVELTVLIDAEIADEILYREALALGLAEHDGIVQRRLAQNMRFLRGDGEADSGALVREALALGLQRKDVVVRRRLVQRMQLAIETRARQPEPTDAELVDYLRRHPARFAEPARVAFSHVFFSRARRGEAAAGDARRALDRLVARGDAMPADGLGDPFLAPREQPLQSAHELGKLFGPGFANEVLALAPGGWAGPLRSTHGFHVVRVHERRPAAPLPIASVREEVRHAVLAERGQRALRRALDELRDGYHVTVER
jgi:hypothetical protein